MKPKKEARRFAPPVAWLGGRDLLANIKYFVLFAMSSGKLDMRDWMTGKVFPDRDSLRQRTVEEFWAQYQSEPEDGEFWFDYVADSGDGMTATYSIAYLSLGDLLLEGGTDWTNLSDRERNKRLATAMEGSVTVLRDGRADNNRRAGQVLKRGAFLFVGGDTTYHIADYSSLANRFQEPFSAAHDDLYGSTSVGSSPRRDRLLFGLPGNHDYYDELDGFNRQFRKPITEENDFLDLHGRNLPPQLKIKGFQRRQSASYVALRLPFDWWFWGVDCEVKRQDLRQQEFFKSILNAPGVCDFHGKPAAPRKLIVATPEPTTVGGRRSSPDDKTAQAFSDLNLSRPFLYWSAKPKDSEPLDQQFAAVLEEERLLGYVEPECRLDISGDTHHYARYWGGDLAQGGEVVPNYYASVVSGGGGASMSPTQTDAGEIRAEVRYPAKKISSWAINKELFNPHSVYKGGNVYLAGAAAAAIAYAAAAINCDSSGLIPGGGCRPITQVEIEWATAAAPLVMLALAIGLLIAALVHARAVFDRLSGTYDLAYNFATNPEKEISASEEAPIRNKFVALLAKIRSSDHADRPSSSRMLFLGAGFVGVLCGGTLVWLIMASYAVTFTSPLAIAALVGSVALAAVTTMAARSAVSELFRIKKTSLRADSPEKLEKVEAELRPHLVGRRLDYIPFWTLLVLGALWAAVGILTYRRAPYPWQFGTGVFFILGMAASLVCLGGGIYYSSWLFKQSYRINLSRFSYWPVYALHVLAVAIFAATVWNLKSVPLRILTLDVALTLIVALIVGGCIALAVWVGNKTRGIKHAAWFGILGIWHGLLQIATPLLLVWVGGVPGFLAGLAAALLVFAGRRGFARIAVAVESDNEFDHRKRRGPRLALTLVWFAYGTAILVMPILIRGYIDPYAVRGIFPVDGFWWKVAGELLAVASGAIFSCVWLGWYFAIALLFNGHSNEAGSTALVEDYKQFIRFRLTEDTLTGYVVAVDKVEKEGDKLKPRLIDVIHLQCRNSGVL
jgi:hypothetical protein